MAVPSSTRSDAGMAAVSLVADTKCVLRATPFHSSLAPDTNCVPLTVRVKPSLPGGLYWGDSALMDGTGLAATARELRKIRLNKARRLATRRAGIRLEKIMWDALLTQPRQAK